MIIIINILFFLIMLLTWKNAWVMGKLKESDLTVKEPEKLAFYITVQNIAWIGACLLVFFGLEISIPMLICEILIFGNIFGNNAMKQSIEE